MRWGGIDRQLNSFKNIALHFCNSNRLQVDRAPGTIASNRVGEFHQPLLMQSLSGSPIPHRFALVVTEQ